MNILRELSVLCK